MPPPRRVAAPRLPDELWCDVAAWLTVPEAVALLEVERATAGLRDRLPWATLVACNTTLWTPHVRRALTAAKKDGDDEAGAPPPAWTYARTAALFSSLRFHTDHADRFDPVPTCVLPVTADVDVYARAVTTIQDLEEATCTVTPRGLCLWDGDASTLTWHDWARDDAAGTLLDPVHARGNEITNRRSHVLALTRDGPGCRPPNAILRAEAADRRDRGSAQAPPDPRAGCWGSPQADATAPGPPR